MKRNFILLALIAMTIIFGGCDIESEVVNDIRVYVPEEGGINFEKITDETMEKLTSPGVSYSSYDNHLNWWVNPLFSISSDGNFLAYNVFKNEKRNIFIKTLEVRGSSTQRTTRTNVNDVCISPDGKTICFSETDELSSRLYTTSAIQGVMVTQVSPVNVQDYGPCFSKDGKRIFFSRADGNNYLIWSYDVERGSFSNYCYGMNPSIINDEEFLCTRKNSKNNFEIWRINFVKGTESIVLSQDNRSFTTASVSPDGEWIVCVGNTLRSSTMKKENLDIYVVRTDGSHLTQITYHHGHDCSPVWGPDGKTIYFMSQRGTKNGEYNIWKMNFDL